MAQKYRKIDPRIWRDEKFRRLTAVQKLVAVYCLTAQANRCGIFAFSTAFAHAILRGMFDPREPSKPGEKPPSAPVVADPWAKRIAEEEAADLARRNKS